MQFSIFSISIYYALGNETVESNIVLTIKEHVFEFIKRNDPRSRFSNIIIGHKTRRAWSNKPVYRCSNCIFSTPSVEYNYYTHIGGFLGQSLILHDRCHTGLHKCIDLAMTLVQCTLLQFDNLFKCMHILFFFLITCHIQQEVIEYRLLPFTDTPSSLVVK